MLTLRAGFRHNADGTFLRYDEERRVLIAGARVDDPPDTRPATIAAMYELAERLNRLSESAPFRGVECRFDVDDHDGTLLLHTEVDLGSASFTSLVLLLARLRRAAEYWGSLHPAMLVELAMPQAGKHRKA